MRNIHKWLRAAFALLTMLAMGCSSDEKVEDFPEKLELSVTSLRFASLASTSTVTLDASHSWEITGVPEWLTVEPMRGNAGVHEIRLSVGDNTTEEEFKVRLVVKSGSINQNFPVYQMEKGVLNVVEKEYLLIGARPSLVVPYTSNVIPEVIIPEEAQSWLACNRTKVVTDEKLVFQFLTDPTVYRSVEVVLASAENKLADTLLIRQYPTPVVAQEKDAFFCTYSTTELVVDFSCNIPLEVNITDGNDWLTLKGQEIRDGQTVLTFTMPKNESTSVHTAAFTAVNEDCEVSLAFSLKQMYKVKDGDVRCLHEATHENAISPGMPPLGIPAFVFMGDGFTLEEIENGSYDEYVERAYGAIFSEEPYKSMKDYFSAYAVYCASNESGISDTQAGIIKDTKFGAAYTNGYGSDMTCEFDGTLAFANEKLGNKFDEYRGCVVLFANGTRYGGTCIMAKDGRAVAICPVSTQPHPQNFEQLVKHEAGGHGFGKLADEYTFGGMMNEQDAKFLKSWQDVDMYMNVWPSETDVPWKDFIGRTAYPEIGIFKGGYNYSGGVWRPTEDGLMNRANDGGFSGYCRYLIWKRLVKIYKEHRDDFGGAPFGYTITNFFEFDAPNTKK